MKEMKFRAWDKQTKSFNHYYDIFIADDGSVLLVYPTGNIFAANQKDYIIQRYTGLEDINGVEIYEGDLVESLIIDSSLKNNILEVKYFNGGFRLAFDGGYSAKTIGEPPFDVIVVGNILEGKK